MPNSTLVYYPPPRVSPGSPGFFSVPHVMKQETVLAPIYMHGDGGPRGRCRRTRRFQRETAKSIRRPELRKLLFT